MMLVLILTMIILMIMVKITMIVMMIILRTKIIIKGITDLKFNEISHFSAYNQQVVGFLSQPNIDSILAQKQENYSRNLPLK